MKKIAFFVALLFVFAACNCGEKKAEEKKVEEAIQKIDSIETDVKTSTEELEKTSKEVKEAVKELENI